MAKKTAKPKETKETPKTEIVKTEIVKTETKTKPAVKFQRDDKGIEWTRYYSHHFVAAKDDGTIVSHADSEEELADTKDAKVYTVEDYLNAVEQ